MNLSNAEYHHLIYDTKAYYVFLRLEKRRLRERLKQVEDTIRDMEYRHKIKRTV